MVNVVYFSKNWVEYSANINLKKKELGIFEKPILNKYCQLTVNAFHISIWKEAIEYLCQFLVVVESHHKFLIFFFSNLESKKKFLEMKREGRKEGDFYFMTFQFWLTHLSPHKKGKKRMKKQKLETKIGKQNSWVDRLVIWLICNISQKSFLLKCLDEECS